MQPYREKRMPQRIKIIARRCGLALHAAGWVCTIAPWAIVVMHYMSFWDAEDIAGDCRAGSPAPSDYCAALQRAVSAGQPPPQQASERREPPAFVVGIVVTQAIAFGLFGAVQVYQFASPTKRLEAERAYIVLSLAAKTILGWLVATNLFVQA